MSTAELKVNMFELITHTSDESTLLRLYSKMKEVFETDYSLSVDDELLLVASYEESLLEENLSTHEQAQQAHSNYKY